MKRTHQTTVGRSATAMGQLPQSQAPARRRLVSVGHRFSQTSGRRRHWLFWILLVTATVLTPAVLLVRISNLQRRYQQDAAAKESEIGRLRLRYDDRITELATTHHDALLDFGDALREDYDARALRYEQAKQVASIFQLATRPAEQHLADLAEEKKRNAPVALARGSIATILETDYHPTLPLLFLDVTVSDPSGDFFSTLSRKDFAVLRSNGRFPILAAPLGTRTDRALSLAILIDTSNSTTGLALEQAKSGASHIITQLPPTSLIKIYAFGDQPVARTDWSTEKDKLVSAITQLTSAGQTALRHTLHTAISDIAARPAPRAILVFTDGHDTAGGPATDVLAANCREHSITVYAVSLRTQQVDLEPLDRLTTETSGLHRTAEHVSELSTAFKLLTTSLVQPVYHLAVHLTLPAVDPLTLTVGGENACRIPIGSRP